MHIYATGLAVASVPLRVALVYGFLILFLVAIAGLICFFNKCVNDKEYRDGER